jgi:hypothetical protein
MAGGTLPETGFMILEDAIDLCDFLEATGRTIPRHKWAAESIMAYNQAQMEAALF